MGKRFNYHPSKGKKIKVMPIKDMETIKQIKTMLRSNSRNLALFILGTSTNLRPSELLDIRVEQVSGLKLGDKIEASGYPSAVKSMVSLNKECIAAIRNLLEDKKKMTKDFDPENYLFEGSKGRLAIPTLNNLVKKWCRQVSLKGNYGGHTLRKTFGYQQLISAGASLHEIMMIFNHMNRQQTLDYLCIQDEEVAKIRTHEMFSTGNQRIVELEQKQEALEKENMALKKTVEDLKESEEKYRTLFDNANDDIVYLDVDGTIQEVSDKGKEIFGYKRDELVGKNFAEIGVLSTEDTQRKMIRFQGPVDRKPINMQEIYAYRKDGTKICVEASASFVRKGDETKGILVVVRDVTERKRTEEALEKYREQLEELVNERTKNLEEANIALKILLKRREKDKDELEEKILANVKELVLPFLEKLKNENLNEMQNSFVEIIEYNLNNIISPFVKELSSRYLNLTATEIQIADIIKQGKTSKEIAEILKMSPRTVDIHRYNIRKKLGINNKKADLTTYLLSLK